MHNNKKAQWMYIVSAAIAALLLVVAVILLRQSSAGTKANLNVFQTCEGQKGHCEESEAKCYPGETAFKNILGCGDEKDKNKAKKLICCLPSPIS